MLQHQQVKDLLATQATQVEPGSVFHEVPELDWDGDGPFVLTKVVKFERPPVHHYVVLTFKSSDVTDEDATEKAIDFLVNAGWTEVQAQPLLVI